LHEAVSADDAPADVSLDVPTFPSASFKGRARRPDALRCPSRAAARALEYRAMKFMLPLATNDQRSALTCYRPLGAFLFTVFTGEHVVIHGGRHPATQNNTSIIG